VSFVPMPHLRRLVASRYAWLSLVSVCMQRVAPEAGDIAFRPGATDVALTKGFW